MLQRHVTFIAADPPRASWFACWDPDDPGGLGRSGVKTGEDALERVDVELVVPAKRGTRRTMVSADKLPMATAIDVLAPLRYDDPASQSAHAWAGAVRAGLALIADARVLPWVSPGGFDTWRVDPLHAKDLEFVADIADSLPAEAHARPVEKRGAISDPSFATRSLFDAVADCFLRTAAAHRVGSLSLFADPAAIQAPQLRPWVNDLATAHCTSSTLTLRVHPPQDEDERWLVRFQLQSREDPSLVVDAADFWQTPVEVMQRLGEQAEITLLAGLRQLGEMVKPLESVLDEVAPVEAQLADDELDLLLDQLDELAERNIEVRWPSELVAPRIERQVVASASAPSGALPTVFDLESLLTVDWEFLLDGTVLTAQELEVLGNAKRAVVPLRGKWVRLDRASRERLKARPPSLSVTSALAAALGADIDIAAEISDDPGDEQIGIRVDGALAQMAKRLVEVAGSREEAEPPQLQAELRPYQRRGLAWMADLCDLGLGGCLADDMGLGKTIQLLALHALRGGPTLVVCPTSLLNNWIRETEKFLPGTPTRTYHGANRNLDGLQANELVVTSYGVVRSDSEALDAVGWNLVVADEAQHAKNPRSRTARALREIRGNSRIALTGTPVENRLSELWSILDWSVPGLLGPLETFRRFTALPIERDNDREATQRLNKLVRPFLLRRKKTDPGIAPDLPPKLERDVIVPLSPEQITLYKATVEESLVEVAEAEGIARRGLVLKLLTALKQITNHPAQYLDEDGPLAERSGKLDALDELLGVADASGESTLIFTQYVKMGNLLVDHLGASESEDTQRRSVAMLHGGQSIKARQELVDRFQSRDLKVLVLSLKAGGTGLNLTAATNVVHYDRWWNPAVEDQATDRAYRIGQDQTVTVHRIITQGTVEDRVAELLRVKRKLAESVIGSGESWIGELSNDDLGDLVRLGVG